MLLCVEYTSVAELLIVTMPCVPQWDPHTSQACCLMWLLFVTARKQPVYRPSPAGGPELHKFQLYSWSQRVFQ